VVVGVPKVQKLLVQCLIASDTSYLGVAVMEVIVPRLFGRSSLGNFQFGFLLGYFGAQVFW
jgi:hypothetical protein